ncbi:MAG: metal-dependent hydrolase [Gemmatimonadaceae bacterium]
MDNVCHSLAGAVLAECGFAQRSRFATAALVIGANIPDLDVLYLFGGDLVGLESRRGWTHGIPALATWPFVVVGAVSLWHKYVRQRDVTEQPVDHRVLLAGSALAVVSHPLLDWLNTYGVRFLMPFSERWFYGDTLFIVDVVLLVLFGFGWWFSRKARRSDLPRSTQPARTAVTLALLYIAIMKLQSARSEVALRETLGMTASTPRDLMIAPLPVSMRSRRSLAATDSGYLLRPVLAGVTRVAVDSVDEFLPTYSGDPLVEAARVTEAYRRFARWSRFPYFIPAPDGDSSVVFVGDARYARGSGDTWAGVRVRITPGR